MSAPKNKKPDLEILKRFKAYHDAYPGSWGHFHIVLEDYNVDDDSVQWCIDNASTAEETELSLALMDMSRSQRLKVASDGYDPYEPYKPAPDVKAALLDYALSKETVVKFTRSSVESKYDPFQYVVFELEGIAINPGLWEVPFKFRVERELTNGRWFNVKPTSIKFEGSVLYNDFNALAVAIRVKQKIRDHVLTLEFIRPDVQQQMIASLKLKD